MDKKGCNILITLIFATREREMNLQINSYWKFNIMSLDKYYILNTKSMYLEPQWLSF